MSLSPSDILKSSQSSNKQISLHVMEFISNFQFNEFWMSTSVPQRSTAFNTHRQKCMHTAFTTLLSHPPCLGGSFFRPTGCQEPPWIHMALSLNATRGTLFRGTSGAVVTPEAFGPIDRFGWGCWCGFGCLVGGGLWGPVPGGDTRTPEYLGWSPSSHRGKGRSCWVG